MPAVALPHHLPEIILGEPFLLNLNKAEISEVCEGLESAISSAKARKVKNLESLYVSGHNCFATFHPTAMAFYYPDKFGVHVPGSLIANNDSMLAAWLGVYIISKMQPIGHLAITGIMASAANPSARVLGFAAERLPSGVAGLSLLNSVMTGVNRLGLWAAYMGSFSLIDFPSFAQAQTVINRALKDKIHYSPLFSETSEKRVAKICFFLIFLYCALAEHE